MKYNIKIDYQSNIKYWDTCLQCLCYSLALQAFVYTVISCYTKKFMKKNRLFKIVFDINLWCIIAKS